MAEADDKAAPIAVPHGYWERAIRVTADHDFELLWPGSEAGAAQLEAPAIGGWWCPAGRHGMLAALPSPWSDREQLELMGREVWSATREVAKTMGTRLQEGAAGGDDGVYWEQLFSGWLLSLVSAVADRAVFLEVARGVAPSARLVAVPPRRPPLTFADALQRLTTELGNAELLSLLAPQFGVALEDRTGFAALSSSDSAFVNRPGPSLFSEVTRALTREPLAVARQLADFGGRRMVRRATARESAGSMKVVGSELVGMGLSEQLGLLRRLPGIRFAPIAPTVDPGITECARQFDRRQLAGDATVPKASLAGLVLSVLPELAPVSVVEALEETRALSVAAYGAASPAAVCGFGANEVSNEFVARCASEGHPIAFVQHGAGYTQLAVNAQERLEMGGAGGTQFWSWGLREPGVVPVASPKLEAIRNSHRGGEGLLLVEGEFPPVRYLTRFNSSPIASETLDAPEMVAEFVTSLPKGLRRELRVRRWVHEGSNVPRPTAFEALPEAERGFGINAATLMQSARLAVITYPDTPFLEAMVIGVPTIGLWSADWDWNPEVAALYEELKDAGVVFHEPVPAAEQVAKVRGAESAWWESRPVRLARERFIQRLARPGDVVDEWSRGLNELSHADGVRAAQVKSRM